MNIKNEEFHAIFIWIGLSLKLEKRRLLAITLHQILQENETVKNTNSSQFGISFFKNK